MKKYVFVDDEKRIIYIQDCELFPDESLKKLEYDFPEGFEFGTEGDYLLIKNKLVYSPLLEEEVETAPSMEERISALEGAVLEMIMGGTA